MKSKLLSIYLPQFHTIPENNEWWGEGFTEWTNVKRGHSFYPGHYQPRKPLHNDYYDLADLSVLERHVRKARRAGIFGFCFYHYYFQGRTLLERPIEDYRDKSGEQFPYCLIWANQSWTRTWYRTNIGNKVLLQQEYGKKEDWEKHFYYLLPFFKDNKYIRVNNKPMYIIYLPQDIPCRRGMFERWQEMAKENGFDGIYLVAMNTGSGKDGRFRLYDAFMEFEPLSTIHNDSSWRRCLHDWKTAHVSKVRFRKSDMRNWIWAKNAFSYRYLCKCIEKKAERLGPQTFPGVFAGWDNSSRKDEEGLIVTGSTPYRFQKHLQRILSIAGKQKKEFVFLNAWNEWSEGAYIEPDQKYGWDYLMAVKEAVGQQGKSEIMRTEKIIL